MKFWQGGLILIVLLVSITVAHSPQEVTPQPSIYNASANVSSTEIPRGWEIRDYPVIMESIGLWWNNSS